MILAQSGQLGIKAPVVGAYSPYSLTAKNAGAAAYGRWSDFKCMATGTQAYKALAKRYLRAFPQNEFFEDDALSAYAYVKIVAEAIRNVGTNPQAIATYVRTHVHHPRIRVPAAVDAVGRDRQADGAVRRPDQGAPPRPG